MAEKAWRVCLICLLSDEKPTCSKFKDSNKDGAVILDMNFAFGALEKDVRKRLKGIYGREGAK